MLTDGAADHLVEGVEVAFRLGLLHAGEQGGWDAEAVAHGWGTPYQQRSLCFVISEISSVGMDVSSPYSSLMTAKPVSYLIDLV
jgi:hypothetical protein